MHCVHMWYLRYNLLHIVNIPPTYNIWQIDNHIQQNIKLLIHLHELSLLTNQTVSNPRLTSWQLCHQFRKFIETWPLETSSTSAMQCGNRQTMKEPRPKAIMHFQKLRLKSCHSDRQAKQSQRQQKRCANFPCQLMRNPTSDQSQANNNLSIGGK